MMKKRIWPAMLSVLMLISLLPASALAAEEEPGQEAAAVEENIPEDTNSSGSDTGEGFEAPVELEVNSAEETTVTGSGTFSSGVT